MDKAFVDIVEEVIGEVKDTPETEETTEEASEETTEEVESESENSDENEDEEETDEDESTDDDETDVLEDTVDDRDKNPSGMNEKDVQAFISLRQENKKNKDALSYLDARAKAMGLAGVDELIEKAKEAELKQNAEKEGVPIEFMKKMNDLETRLNQFDIEKQQAEAQRENERMSRTFELFIQKNKLSDNDINNLANDLTKDGIDLDLLKTLPESAVNKMLETYLPKDNVKQKELAKKEQIKKEVPVNTSSPVSQEATEKIDEVAKMWANHYY